MAKKSGNFACHSRTNIYKRIILCLGKHIKKCCIIKNYNDCTFSVHVINHHSEHGEEIHMHMLMSSWFRTKIFAEKP